MKCTSQFSKDLQIESRFITYLPLYMTEQNPGHIMIKLSTCSRRLLEITFFSADDNCRLIHLAQINPVVISSVLLILNMIHPLRLKNSLLRQRTLIIHLTTRRQMQRTLMDASLLLFSGVIPRVCNMRIAE